MGEVETPFVLRRRAFCAVSKDEINRVVFSRWRKKRASSGRVAQAGFTLLEVLISLLLLSIVLLGLDAVNLSSLRTAKAIWFYQLADLQLGNLQEYYRSGQGKISSGAMAMWNEQNKALLPAGRGEVSDQQVIIAWGDQNTICEHDTIAINGCKKGFLSLKH